MSENPTPVEGVRPATVDLHADVNVQRLSVPLGWVATLISLVAAGAVSLALIYYRAEAHADDHALHLAPDVATQGGVVTARKLRKVLRQMTIKCDKGPEGGLSCHVELPEEAD